MSFSLPDLAPEIRERVPRLIFPQRPELLRAYEAAWATAARDGVRGGGVIGSTLSQHLYQWDVLFTPFWLRYAPDAFEMEQPLGCLDVFYNHQRDDGALPLCIRNDGVALFADSREGWDSEEHEQSAFVLPPAPFAWAEWEYFSVTGEASRLARVLPKLAAHFDWQMQHCTRTEGYFFWTPPARRTHPLHDKESHAWADYTAQAALECECLANIAHTCDAKDIADAAAANYLGLKELMNAKLWDELKGTYIDIDEDELPLGALHAGAFWALRANIPTTDRADILLRHIETYRQFARPHPIPTLAASEKWFHRQGTRWRGGVWPPLCYVAFTAAALHPRRRTITAGALRHVEAIAQSLLQHGTFHDSYAPDFPGPALGARPGFSGWSNLAPISLLIEEVIGIKVDAPLEKVTWRLFLEEDHGIENLRVGKVVVSLTARWVAHAWVITAQTTGPVLVQIETSAGTDHHEFDAAGQFVFRRG